ncbi:lysine--tRNA ligase [Rubrobacter radiotolerans]|uniref:Lysine--tRNA ligase n=1 Tax=Rubrobacter radiotolerans TaxID=42256 RepID=A0A023X4V1_RUBRA|nr:lysine--tRNA ligase [Rubrobacter radiotolerans]AHY47251.1 lysine--tRNA ligase [Rubrobacter radiotolerans]MDX5894656.1 lysine--tRNA ligase [Rubrobacter radiotolerans]SMC06483.1 lysyl-tRNA synthetase, class I [Rubrobacter radiotolerans DSM 5868]
MAPNAPDWAKRTAERLGDGPHLVVSGISPSGNIHAGNLLEVLVSEAVANALRERGEEVRFIFHADTIDPLRKIAPGIPDSFRRYLGHSLSHIPDPFAKPGDEYPSYAERFLGPFEDALGEMEMDIEVVRSHELYERGVYTEVIRESIEKTEPLRSILQEVSGREMPEEWSPFLPRNASGDLTGNRVVEHLPDRSCVVYVDRDGNEGVADYAKGEGKLGWRVELAARWKALGVTFEPFGKDHTSRGGSTDTADRMSREVFGYPVPGRYEYEWIGIKGAGAMSSSRGIVLLPGDLLRIMPPDAVRKLLLPRDPSRAFDIDLTAGFPAFMDRYRRERGTTSPVPFTHLVTVAQTVGGDADLAREMLVRGGYEVAESREELARDLRYARNWSEEWAPPEQRLKVLSRDEAAEAAATLDEEQRRYLGTVAGRLGEGEADGEAVQDLLYGTAVELGLKPKRAFGALYTVLLGKKSGPKAGPFVAGLPPQLVKERLTA